MKNNEKITRCFSNRTFLEKILIFATVILLLSLVGTIIDFHTAKIELRSSIPVCETDACKAIGSSILRSLDLNANPCQDFYSYACGGWIKSHDIPKDAQFYDVTRMIKDNLLLKVNDLLSSEENSTLSQFTENAKRFYDSCMNTENIERLGVTPLLKLLSDVGGWPLVNDTWDASKYDFLSAMAQIQLRTSFGFVVLIMVGTDPLNTSTSILQLHKPSFSMSTKVLLNQQKESSKKELEHYRNFFISIAELLGTKQKNLTLEFNSIIDFESKLASFVTPEENLQKFDDWYNKRSIRSLRDNFTKIDLLWYLQMVTNSSLKPLGESMVMHEDDQVIIRDTKYFISLENFLSESSDFKRRISNYLGWRLIMSNLQYMPAKFDEALQNYSRESGITRINPERWKMCTTAAISQFSDDISLSYIRKHFPKEVQKEVQKLILDLKFQFEMTLHNSSWMDDNTTAAALTKLYAMNSNIGYPLWMSDTTNEYYLKSKQPSMTDNIFENDLALSQHVTMETIQKLRNKNKKQLWTISPITINAGYNRNQNAITPPILNHVQAANWLRILENNINKEAFPAAFLQPPLYNPFAPRFYNYAAIGSIIGHEITHGFDNEGRQRNASGEMQDWWSKDSAAEFKKRAECFVKQYDSYQLNGGRTLSENIADNGGLRQAYSAYMEWKEKGADVLGLPDLDRFTIDQQFFLVYGNIWCTKYKPEAWNTSVSQDIHAQSRYRLIGTIANLPGFAEAFHCDSKSTDDKKENCVIW